MARAKVWMEIEFEGRTLRLTDIAPRQLKFKTEVDRRVFYEAAMRTWNLSFCPAGLAQRIREKYRDQDPSRVVRVVEQPADGTSTPRVWRLARKLAANLADKIRGEHVIAEDLGYVTCTPSERSIFVLPEFTTPASA